MKTIANVSGFLKNNDEFYTSIEPIIELKKMLNLPPNSVILCPFDTAESEFVKVFQAYGHKVIYSHISERERERERIIHTQIFLIIQKMI